MCFVMELCRQSLFKLLHDTKTPLSEQKLINYAVRGTSALVALCESMQIKGVRSNRLCACWATLPPTGVR